jgi:RNA polymerase sigma-70 factor, ECF subfamily
MHREMTDEDLLAQFGRGRRDALGTLAERHERGLLGLALGMLGDRQRAEDAVQETWTRVIRGARAFEGRCRVKTWLYTICMNRCRDLRRERMGSLADGAVAEMSPTVAPPDEASALRDLVDRLGEGRREVLLLCYHDGITHEIAAEILGIPVGTVKSRLHAALGELRERMAPEGAR